MKDEGLFVESPVPAAEMTVKKMWVVSAGETYNISRSCQYAKDYTLIRTLKGSGHITLKDNQDFFPAANSILLVHSNEVLNYHTESSLWDFSWIEFSGVPPLPLNTLISQAFCETEFQDSLPDIESRSNFICPNCLV